MPEEIFLTTKRARSTIYVNLMQVRTAEIHLDGRVVLAFDEGHSVTLHSSEARVARDRIIDLTCQTE
jgi:hypothetical protein